MPESRTRPTSATDAVMDAAYRLHAAASLLERHVVEGLDWPVVDEVARGLVVEALASLGEVVS